MNIREEYPDSIQLAHDELGKIDDLMAKADEWKDGRFIEQMYSFSRKLDDDAKTAMIVRSLEDCGFKGVPESNEILMAMFNLIELTALITLHFVANEDVRL